MKYSKPDWDKKFSQPNYYGTGPSKFATLCKTFLEKNNFSKIKLLDLGCGQGNDSIYFSNHGIMVTALDLSKEGLKSIPDTIKKVVCDIRDLSRFDDESFDVVYSHFSIHFFTIDELVKIVEEISRILKPKGHFMFVAKTREDFLYGGGKEIEPHTFLYDDGIRYFFSEDVIKKLLHKFSVKKLDKKTSQLSGKNPATYFEIIAQKN